MIIYVRGFYGVYYFLIINVLNVGIMHIHYTVRYLIYAEYI